MTLRRLLPFLLSVFFLSTCNALDRCLSSSSSTSDLSILHIYSKCSPFSHLNPSLSRQSTLLYMIAGDESRLSFLSGEKTTVPLAFGGNPLQITNYVIRAKLGTPGKLFFMVLDNSNNAAWVPCVGCTGCVTSSTTFNPRLSHTYTPILCKKTRCISTNPHKCFLESTPCSFNQTYGGNSTFSATLSRDVLRLALDVIPNYSFGCVNAVAGEPIPPQGLLGLGRGKLSLLSQTNHIYDGVFSYCLPSFRSLYFTGSLKLGRTAQPRVLKFTPLLKNPHRPSLYYINMTGISINKKMVPIPKDLLTFTPTTGAGTIVDSGTVITRFVKPVYDAVRNQFRQHLKGKITSLGAFDTCFATPFTPPSIILHFDGMDFVLPHENAVIHSSAGSFACLAMAAVPDNVNSVLNVIANLQQQNHRFLFDVANSKLGIRRELCN